MPYILIAAYCLGPISGAAVFAVLIICICVAVWKFLHIGPPADAQGLSWSTTKRCLLLPTAPININSLQQTYRRVLHTTYATIHDACHGLIAQSITNVLQLKGSSVGFVSLSVIWNHPLSLASLYFLEHFVLALSWEKKKKRKSPAAHSERV